MMSECANVEMRERLPELMHGRLPASVVTDVQAHLASCADCRAELELLERARAAGQARAVDTARIIAAIPAYRPAPAWRRAVRLQGMRAAAAVLLVAGGFVALRGGIDRETGSTPDVGLAIGDTFQGLTDDDLRALLAEMPNIQPVTPVATDAEAAPAAERDSA